jgi:hypothetical protein
MWLFCNALVKTGFTLRDGAESALRTSNEQGKLPSIDPSSAAEKTKSMLHMCQVGLEGTI